MKSKLAPYKLALILKEKEFDEECLFAYYHKSDLKNFKESDYSFCGDRNNSQLEKDGRISAPLYQDVNDWLREKHRINIVVDDGPDDLGYSYTFYYYKDSKLRESSGFGHDEIIEKEYTYYEAFTKAIEEALKLI